MAIIGLILFIVFIIAIDRSKLQNNIDLNSIDLEKIDQMDGLTFEHYVSELLKKNGYNKVLVTKSSGDFGVDITVYKDMQKYAFQCKNYRSKLGVSPIQQVYSGAPKYNATVCVVVTNSYFTPHAQELAKSLGVVLWDRIELSRLMQKVSKCSITSQKIETLELEQTQDFARPNTKIEFLKSNSEKETPEPEAQNIVQKTFSPSPSTMIHATENEFQHKQIITDKHSKSSEDFPMATTLGAGKYIFGVDIPEGKYNLKAISGYGVLTIQKLIDGNWEEECMNFGVAEYNAKTYHGLSLPRNKYFEVSGSVIFEITKATMIEIE